MQPGSVRTLSILLAAAVCCGCASKKPIIDTTNVDMDQYDRDLAHCEEVATQVETGGRAVDSAAAGAAVGAARGAIWGSVGRSAASGAVTGGAGGLYAADYETARVIKNCMRSRGYAVLN